MTFERAFTARADDIDELGHVNNAVWVRWMEAVSVAHWQAVAEPAHVDAYVWVVTRHEIDYARALKQGKTVTARTWVDGQPKGARFDRVIEFVGEGGTIHVRSRTTWAILDRATGRPLRVPAEVAAPFVAPDRQG